MAKYIHETIYITESQTWRAPKAENQAFEVTIYGAGGSGSLDSFDGVLSGGGGGSYGSGGGSGYFNPGYGGGGGGITNQNGGNGICIVQYYTRS